MVCDFFKDRTVKIFLLVLVFLTFLGLSNPVTMAEGMTCKLHPTQKQIKLVNMN